MILVFVEWPRHVQPLAAGPGTVLGANVAGAGLVKAAVAHPAVSRVAARVPAHALKALSSALASSPAGSRIEPMSPPDLARAFGADDPVILVGLGPDLTRALQVRWLAGNRPWPIQGVTHSLSTPGVFRQILLSLLGPVQPYDAIVCTSHAAAAALQAMVTRAETALATCTRPRMPIVPLGVHTRDFPSGDRRKARAALGWPSEQQTILYLGRINPQYKADLAPLIRVLPSLAQRHDAQLVLAGATEADETAFVQLRFRAAELGVADRLTCLPNPSEAQRLQLLQAADVFVSPVDCLQESFGLSVVEAMAAGLPVVASDWDGYRDLVEHESTGLLVPTSMPTSSATISARAPLEQFGQIHWELGQATAIDLVALEAALDRLLADPDLRRRYGEAGRRRARSTFDWTVVVDRLLEEWTGMFAQARRLGPPSDEPPLWYDHGEVFRAHATHPLDAGTHVVAGPDPGPPSIMLAPPPFLDPQRLRDIAGALTRPRRITDLPGPPEETLFAVAYLLKQGILRIADGDDSLATTR